MPATSLNLGHARLPLLDHPDCLRLGEPALPHVVCPLVSKQTSAPDGADDGLAVRKDPDRVRRSGFAVHALERVGAVQLRAQALLKAMQARTACPASSISPAASRNRSRRLPATSRQRAWPGRGRSGEDCPRHGAHHRLAGPARARRQGALEMHAAALPPGILRAAASRPSWTPTTSCTPRRPRRATDRRMLPAFPTGSIRRNHAGIFSISAGVMPPMPMFGRSLLDVQSHCAAKS